MKRIYPCTLFFICISHLAVSQNTLSGNIRDLETGESLPGATIYISDLKKGATANLNGDYVVENMPSGKFLVEARYIGYATASAYLRVAEGTIFNFELSPSATEIDNVVITGVSIATEASKNPVPTTFLNKDELESASATNIIDAITRKPGVSQISTGPSIGKPVIRGLGYNRVVTLNNSIKQEGQQWGDEHGIEIDEFSVEKVEIIKGPGSLMYGSDAMAGVINFLPPNPLNEGQIKGSLSGNFQTNNNQQGYSLMNAGNLDGFNWRIRTSYKLAGNYQNDEDGLIYNTGFEEFDINGYLGINRKWGYSHLNFSSFSQDVGIAEGERNSEGRFLKLINNAGNIEEAAANSSDLESYGIGFPNQEVKHYTLSSSTNFIVGDSRLSANLGFQQNIRKEFSDPTAPQDTELHMELNTFSYDLKYHLHEFGEWETTVGLSGQHQRNTNFGEEYLIPAYQLTDGGVFVVAQHTIDKLSLNGGVRFDYRKIIGEALYLDANGAPVSASSTGAERKFEPFERSFSNVVGSVGISYQFNDKVLSKLNISRGFRAPNIAEIGSNGEHEGTFRYEIGNKDLNSEKSLQLDLGIEVAGDHITLQTNAFVNNISDFIFLQKLSSSQGGDSISGGNEPQPVFQYTQGEAYIYGGEILLDLHPHPLDWLHFENTFSISLGQLRNQPDSMKYTPFQPAPKIRSELRADLRQGLAGLSKLSFNINYAYYFEQNRVFSAFNTETPTPAYGIFGAGVSADFVKIDKSPLFSIHLIASNLFDNTYQSHLSRLKYAPENPATGKQGLYNMGRNISVKVYIPLVFK